MSVETSTPRKLSTLVSSPLNLSDASINSNKSSILGCSGLNEIPDSPVMVSTGTQTDTHSCAEETGR